ncbi:hypothetical protein A3L14_06770 [Thermococcus thioreducens]|uniref:DUF835 domain-containing protein n=1 Tax=Thermococcus thioreducens TaxID=277988 RepID=A0A0Q2QQY3_9EURY|nr:hypothetical protein A3L14_06770 [Thermococcus thioreducens]KQH82397.1 hypothetical protein AMR53_05470 [Thermococcus thioreducens]SEV87960.1 Protein of unknown function [Thermococcus thioreducens]
MLEVLNVAMRFSTWGFTTYRWIRKREGFLLFLSLALWIDSLAALAQKPILENLGLHPEAKVLVPLLSLLAVVEGILLLVTSLYLHERLGSAGGQVLILLTSVGGSAYVLLAALFDTSPLLMMAFPLPFLGLSLMATGYALIKKEIGIRSTATLFPMGAFLLGAINFTYPVTITTALAPYLYGAGALFRVMMFIGMAKYALFQIMPPKAPVGDMPHGAFYVDNKRHLASIIQRMKSTGNGVLITRTPPEDETPTFPVFWVTRVASTAPWKNIVTVRPTDIGILIDLVKKHLEKGHSIVVLDCFEYLVLENGFENALKFLLSLKDHVVRFGGALIVATDPSMYSEKQWTVMLRELDRLEF